MALRFGVPVALSDHRIEYGRFGDLLFKSRSRPNKVPVRGKIID